MSYNQQDQRPFTLNNAEYSAVMNRIGAAENPTYNTVFTVLYEMHSELTPLVFDAVCLQILRDLGEIT